MKKNIFSSFRTPQEIDKPLAIIAGFLLVFGFAMLYSASVAVGIDRFGDSLYYVKKQAVALLVGSVALYLGYRIDYRLWQKWSFMLLLGSLLLLLAVFIPGIGIHGQGAQRWIDVGFYTFQPSELVKLTLIIYLSAWIAERGERAIRDVRTGAIPFISVMAILAFLILSQPDLGTLLIISFIGLALFFVGGAKLTHVAAIISAGIFGVLVAIKAAPYRLARLTSFLNPAADPQGAGYHISQALIAVGSGGFFGRGLGHSRQKFLYLPEVTGDSIFAVIGEELGFVFSAALLVLFVLFFWRALVIARNASDTFGKLIAIGIGTWITAQAFINISAMLAILPLTGMPLPFISYGGSSLIVCMAGLGILLHIAKHGKTKRI